MLYFDILVTVSLYLKGKKEKVCSVDLCIRIAPQVPVLRPDNKPSSTSPHRVPYSLAISVFDLNARHRVKTLEGNNRKHVEFLRGLRSFRKWKDFWVEHNVPRVSVVGPSRGHQPKPPGTEARVRGPYLHCWNEFYAKSYFIFSSHDSVWYITTY